MSNSEDVDQFLQRMRTMSDQRDRQDAERVKKLEEELIQGRSERLARRAERARSLSPDKPTTPQSLRSPTTTAAAAAAAAATPQAQVVEKQAAETPTPVMDPPSQDSAGDSTPQLLEDTEPKKPAPSAAALGRSGTLSWQRRPQSGSIRRPISLAAPSPTADKPFVSSPEPSPEAVPSRDVIAQSLGAKDPSWFKQTADRGVGSAAYRRTQDDNASETGSVSGKRQLPGLARESTANSEPPTTSPPLSAPSSTVLGKPFSMTPASAGGAKSPLPVLESQKFAPPSEPASSVDAGDRTSRGLAMSPTQGRISPERERSTSPTKGMGGFVQSAMLKRSDSVSKRWSAVPTSPSRAPSTLSNRGSMYGTTARAEGRPSTLSRDNSVEPSSRPGSSAGIPAKDASESPSKSEFTKPALPYHSRSKSVHSTFSDSSRKQQDDDASPHSPSKRWSPTKSSWLESALSKPESPKAKQAPSAQPAWMSEISRIKQQRGSVDMGRGSPLHSPVADVPNSGRSSPIKDVQLRPVSLRARSESPNKKEILPEPAKITTPALSSQKPKPVLAPKPSIAAAPEAVSADDPPPAKEEPSPAKEVPSPTKEVPSPVKEEPEAPKEAAKTVPAVTSPKPLASTPRFSKDAPVSSPVAKPKPETPPKKDFRANLRPRQNTVDGSKGNEVSELASVFGKLRKAETKNYVAPDTFKDNILRGKSGLNITGGPKPSVRRDEFRESLISQKTAMLAKAQEVGSAAHKRGDSSSKPTETPEALAMRRNLGRSDSISKVPQPKEKEKESPPEALAKIQALRASKSLSTVKPGHLASSSISKEPVVSPVKESARSSISREPAAPLPSKEPAASPFKESARSSISQEPAASPISKEPVKSNKFADRFNPALAGLLARGPPPMATKSGSGGDSTPAAEEKPAGPAPELTHMTKGRARGPKRRTPASKQTAAQDTQQSQKAASEDVAEKATPVVDTAPLVKAEHVLPSSTMQSPKTNNTPEDLPVKRTSTRESIQAKPATPIKSPDLTKKLDKSASPELPKKPTALDLNRRISGNYATPKKSPMQISPTKASPKHSPAPSPSLAKTISLKGARPLPTPSPKSSPKALQEISFNGGAAPTKAEPSPEKAAFSVKNVTAAWGRQSTTASSAPTQVKSPIKLPTKADEKAAMENAGLARSPVLSEPKTKAPWPKPVGLGLGGMSLDVIPPARSRESSPPKPYSAKAFPISPPLSNDRPLSEPFKASPVPDKPAGVFDEFFDERPVTTGQLADNIDTLQILQNPPFDFSPAGKIRTLRKMLHEVTGDGKLVPIAAHEEHILYEDAMYLCNHTFEDSRGAQTIEVYLWSGNGVAEPTVEDVQIFARNFAKQQQGKLVHMRQGNESPNFFEALGGIVITRRARPSSHQYMLCGRRHLGHIAFDEAEFALKSLCSGYVYIVSTESGKVYLWKGRGCSQEELSAARLMGMDLTPTGDIVEMDEGSEPQAFINVFPPPLHKGPAIPRSADHWRYKATSDRYRARLFKIEQHQSSGWANLQVSSYIPALLRRPSWGGAYNKDKTERPQTPTPSPKSPAVTTKVVEVMPFCQRDLEPEHVYVLDAFFETYIIVGALSRTQHHAFSTALMFAQEYTMLAVSEEDRPFMPISTIVLEGTPRDMKAVFRFWDDAMIPAAGLMRGKLGRGKSLRIVGLEKAIEATRA